MIKIDGSEGEGGGQVIRSSLALSAVTGTPFSIINVRGKRKKSGLLRQHLTAVKAAQKICDAEVVGAELHSSQLDFVPNRLNSGDFSFDIGSAGSTTLVVQTILPALMLAKGNSKITVKGGTHNMAAPPFDFLRDVYFPQINKMGPWVEGTLQEYGFYPNGGGQIIVKIRPTEKLKPLTVIERGGTPEPMVNAIVSKLPKHIAEREVDVIRRKAGWAIGKTMITEVENPRGPGNVVMIRLSSPNVAELVTGFGKVGIKAEDVARKTYREAKAYLDADVPVGEHLADQLLLPMGLAASQGETCQLRTNVISGHTATHIEILKMFLEIEIEVKENGKNDFTIRVQPR